MKILEQILKEIDNAVNAQRKICPDTFNSSIWRGYESGIKEAKEIIRSHIKDEPVSNTDRLDDGWIPAEYSPETNDYILLSFSNFSMPLIGRYEADENGGAFYLGDCDGDDTCISNDLYVNAWRSLPGPYRPKED